MTTYMETQGDNGQYICSLIHPMFSVYGTNEIELVSKPIYDGGAVSDMKGIH